VTLLLDTNVCIAFLKDGDPTIRERLSAALPGDVVLCSIVKAELQDGARRSTRVNENLQRLDAFFRLFESVPFDDGAADQYGLIRAQLAAAGQPIGPNDLLIAATALNLGATVVTRNEAEFRRVPGLRVERW
jgi:tRNA(fMet)-specific endonuclease VapC